jgi:HAE1 family hydrophobic/amphiphilic exporter-1
VPPILVGSYPTSVSNLFAGRFPATQVQLRFSLPLRNRTAEANLESNLAEARRIREVRQQTELAIEASVRNSMQAVEMAKLRLDASRVARASSEEQYESEQRQFRAGTSTLFLVQQRQNEMITARSQERLSESALGKAIADFDLATGRTLTVRNINIK